MGDLSTWITKSSPRPWGCFFLAFHWFFLILVFPTPVGVFLQETFMDSARQRLPHARGGVSMRPVVCSHTTKSSPRPWGCFSLYSRHAAELKVFPTPVGVFLSGYGALELPTRLPHARGGVSRVAV